MKGRSDLFVHLPSLCLTSSLSHLALSLSGPDGVRHRTDRERKEMDREGREGRQEIGAPSSFSLPPVSPLQLGCYDGSGKKETRKGN